jgi:very-short-patch-repair endonuclease
VYSLGSAAMTALERASAAVLACGAGAALSHESALALWGLSDRWQQRMHVTVPGDIRRPGILIHRSPSLTSKDTRRHQGIRVTSPARTVLDCAPRLSKKRLTRIVNDGLREGLLKPGALEDVALRFPLHRGHKHLIPLLDSPKNSAPTRSEFEDGFIVFCANHNLPRPKINTRVGKHEVDAYFEAEGLIVELDGWDFHKDKASFERDRTRDADALAAGLPTVRITWDRMTLSAAPEAARLRKILASASAAAARRREPGRPT